MTQEEIKVVNLESKKDDLDEFARYLGVDYEDLYELNYRKKYYEDIDFDDYSR